MIIEQSGRTGRVRTARYEEMEQEGGQISEVYTLPRVLKIDGCCQFWEKKQ